MKTIIRKQAICFITCVLLVAVSRTAFALCGDVGGDGLILSNDVLMVARASIGTLTLTTDQMSRADVTISGTLDGQILSNDVLMIARASIGTVSSLICTAGSGTIISGTVSAPSGVSLGRSAGRSAAATGLVVKASVSVEAYLIDNNGNKTGNTLATATSNASGVYSLTLPAGTSPASNLIVIVGAGSNIMRAIVASASTNINPMTELVTEKIVASTQPLSNFSTTEVQAVLGDVENGAETISLTGSDVQTVVSNLNTGGIAATTDQDITEYSGANDVGSYITAIKTQYANLDSFYNSKNVSSIMALVSSNFFNEGQSRTDIQSDTQGFFNDYNNINQTSDSSNFEISGTGLGATAKVLVHTTTTATNTSGSNYSDSNTSYDYWKLETDGIWRVIGDQKKGYAQVRVEITPTGDVKDYQLYISAGIDSQTIHITSATVSGPGITGTTPITQTINNDWAIVKEYGAVAIGDTYTITLNYSDSSSETFTETVKSLPGTTYPQITYPTSGGSISATPTITWTNVSGQIQYFKDYMLIVENPQDLRYWKRDKLFGSTTSVQYNDDGTGAALPSGQLVYIALAAEDIFGNTSGSRILATVVPPPPAAVTLNDPSSIVITSMGLSWTQSDDAAFASYKLYRSTSPGVSQSSTLVSTITNKTTTSATASGLSASTKYYFKVYVCDAYDQCAGGNEVNGTTTVEIPPGAVTLSDPSSIAITSMALSWTQSGDAAFASYKLYRSTSSDVSQSSTLVSTITNKTTTSATAAGLSATTKYYFKVYVCNASDQCAGGNVVNGTTGSGTLISGAYTAFELTADGVSSPVWSVNSITVSCDGNGTCTCGLGSFYYSVDASDTVTIFPGTYSPPAGTYADVSSDGGIIVISDGNTADGQVSLGIWIKQGTGMSNASVNGTYNMMEFGADTNRTSPWTTSIRNVLDGAGNFTFQELASSDVPPNTLNNGSGKYAVSSNGAILLGDAVADGSDGTGIVSADGKIVVIGNPDDESGGSPACELFIAIKTSSGLNFNSTNSHSNIHYMNLGASVFTGLLSLVSNTTNGAGTSTMTSIYNSAGYSVPSTLNYTIGSNGVFTNTDNTGMSGMVTSDGKFGAMVTVSGSSGIGLSISIGKP